MNITLSFPESTVVRARQAAQAMGKSLNEVIRQHIEALAGADDIEGDLTELRGLSLAATGDRKGWRWNRDEIHERS